MKTFDIKKWRNEMHLSNLQQLQVEHTTCECGCGGCETPSSINQSIPSMKKSQLANLIREELKSYKVTAQNQKEVESELRKKGVQDPRVKPGQDITAEETENLHIGHIDDEPGMLKQTAYEIAQYGADLYKLLKQYDQLPQKVDFPHWWQANVVKARELISKATHYLEFETQEPILDRIQESEQEDDDNWVDQAIKDYEEMEANRYSVPMRDDEETL
jgi:hypothetical protein